MTGSNTKYHKLQEALKAELSGGAFQTGDRFYTEKEIMKKFHVSCVTAARALNEMTQQGYFERKRKLGTFVLESPEMPGMSGNIMTRPLYLNRVALEELSDPRSDPSWFVIDEMRRGMINTFPGAVKIISLEEIPEVTRQYPDALAVLYLGTGSSHYEEYAAGIPRNSILITLPPQRFFAEDSVRPNYFVGVYEAIAHLVMLGHTRIAFIGPPRFRDRFAAYRIALETFDIPFRPELVVREMSPDNFTAGGDAMRQLLAAPEPPTAVFAGTDKLALGAVHAASETGLRIPEDLSVIGFDDIPAAALSDIPLSTVRIPYFELGKTAVELLLQKLKSGGASMPSKTIMSQFIVRKSTAPCKFRQRNSVCIDNHPLNESGKGKENDEKKQ